MTTAFQAYQEPIDDYNRWDRQENEEHSWDGGIDRLRAQDEGEHPSRRPPGTIAAQSPIAHARYLAYLARVAKRRENEERVEELMVDFEARLEKGR